MLSKEDNRLLTSTDAGTPMGDLMRRYWLPALLSEEIPEPDCPPVRVKLLGEDLVAFRDSQGRIGLLGEACAHRGTSLYYGRNEECGLRCIYHGWKFDVQGNVLETPAEPSGSDFKGKLKHKAYPTKEVAGIVYTYMGPEGNIPLFPNYEWTQLRPEQVYVAKCLQECNYLQCLEGDCDSSHLSYLHRGFTESTARGGDPGLYALDGAPDLTPVDMDYGVRMISRRNGEAGEVYLRVSNFVMPSAGFIPTGGTKGNREGYSIHSYTPADDGSCWRYMITFRRTRPVREKEKRLKADIGPDYRKFRNLGNHYLQDREEQRKATFIGLGTSFLVHDSCATESMGRIYDRSKEHLGTSDRTVIAVRRFLLNAVKAFQNGAEPPHLVTRPEENSFHHIACIAVEIPSSKPADEYIEEYIEERSRLAGKTGGRSQRAESGREGLTKGREYGPNSVEEGK